ncbi:transcriptional regulator NanR [Halomonas alkalisoli]|uniref:transcriptional regulator NanR n=1 Tax=Halomonas alkalisoli TaxID=2907158 RepID=UPI001F1B942C|nr:transcriptional regulator NanR [Halomonas alkalisoli]MCE9683453.1 transcriptional regulator NanR [Halomonas alkalisoli]
MNKEPIRRRKLSHEVLDRLLARMRNGDFPVGTTLPSERELMEQFAVGRPAVREALQALERMGFIKIVHGEGALVTPISAATVLGQISDAAMHMLSGSKSLLEDLKEARVFFEVGMVRIAAERASDEDIAVLRGALAEHRASITNPEKFHETDMALHRAIATISQNRVYSVVSQAMLKWLENFHADLVWNLGAEEMVLEEHEEIVECIAAHDPDRAVERMVQHLTRANQHYNLEREKTES